MQELEAIKIIEDLTANVNMGENSKLSNRAFHLSMSRATSILRQYFVQQQQSQIKAKSEPKADQKVPAEKAANA